MAVAEALRLVKHRAPRNAPKTFRLISCFATAQALSTVRKYSRTNAANGLELSCGRGFLDATQNDLF